VTDLGDGQVGGPKQVLSPLDAPLREIGRRADAVGRREQALEVVLAHPRDGRQCLEAERIGVVAIRVITRAT